jgi:hypothetical protein
MATKQEIATEVQFQMNAIVSGIQKDLLEDGVPPNACKHAIKYNGPGVCFYYVTKDGSKPDIYMDADVIYSLLYESAKLKLDSPEHQLDKQAFANAQVEKIQARIDADKA